MDSTHTWNPAVRIESGKNGWLSKKSLTSMWSLKGCPHFLTLPPYELHVCTHRRVWSPHIKEAARLMQVHLNSCRWIFQYECCCFSDLVHPGISPLPSNTSHHPLSGAMGRLTTMKCSKDRRAKRYVRVRACPCVREGGLSIYSMLFCVRVTRCILLEHDLCTMHGVEWV